LIQQSQGVTKSGVARLPWAQKGFQRLHLASLFLCFYVSIVYTNAGNLLFVPGSAKRNEFHREFTVSRRDGATASSQ
jgi:hypothetical protein